MLRASLIKPWRVRHCTGKLTGNQQEDWSSREKLEENWGLSSPEVENLHEIDISFGDRRLIDT